MSQPRIRRSEYARARRVHPWAAAFAEGRRARQFGRPAVSNPYPARVRRWLWAAGWEWQDRFNSSVDASTHVCGRTERKS